ncbi:hypothetical protein LTR10_021497 [Elasticomyces elasticus]|uniref:CHRD domain-containing protein n=1 Tax=Exophiala sideris TaxID=1016849 RepID=A0ABR0J987_9EURO|nr:hypothetical protein LTR10_021497 [Elasticomyces elasticus]KAK5037615.1 hypothetical protein LTR13_004774 [Exophiala sideris]KAK5059277.1 hypothetical protein LTR69_006567 [Exophiala sideris]KAK5183111.1 hypothetical protein LTR44_004822 [Eurotiomycetes sp. CCFEE 6388]
MVSSTSTLLAILPVLSTLVSAGPIAARTSNVSVTFIGAADAQYTLDIPVSSTWTPTNNVLSISHIHTSAGGPCVFFGIDGAVFVAPAEGGYGDVGPPQTIVGGICGPFPGQDYGMW